MILEVPFAVVEILRFFSLLLLELLFVELLLLLLSLLWIATQVEWGARRQSSIARSSLKSEKAESIMALSQMGRALTHVAGRLGPG